MATTFESVMLRTFQYILFVQGEFGYNRTHGLIEKHPHGQDKADHDTLVKMRGKVEGYQKADNRDGSIIPLGLP